MKSKLGTILLLLMTFICTSAQAQEKDWFVRAGASTNYYWGENDASLKIKDRFSMSYNLTIGKWFNPYWGVQLGGNYGKIKGAGYGQTPYTTGEKIEKPVGGSVKDGVFNEKWNFITVQPEIVYNVSNGMCGFNEKRVWNVLAHIGPNIGRSWANGESQISVYATAGLTSTWRLARNVQLWASGRLTVFGKKFDKVTYRDDIDCMGTVSAGISINFGK